MTKNKFLVCHFLIDPRLGGPHKFLEACSDVIEDEYESIVFICGKSKFKSYSILNLRFINRYLYPVEVLVNILFIILIILYYKFRGKKIIFSISGVHNIAPAVAAFFGRVPVVLLILEGMPSLKFFANLTLFFIKINGGRVLSVSKDALKTYGITGRAEVIYSPINTSFWNLEVNSRRRFFKINDKIKLIFVGNLNPIKSLHNLLISLEYINRPISLYVIGPKLNSYVQYYEELIKKSDLLINANKNIDIKFLGQQDSISIRDYLYSADIFFMASTSEGCPIALIEAMATGCIPLTTNIGDVYEFLTPIMPELICSGPDPKSLSLSLTRLINKLSLLSGDELDSVRAKLVNLVEVKFDSLIVAKKISKEYKLAINEY